MEYRIELNPKIDDDIEAERYANLRDAAILEKRWIHERLSWLFTPQAFLFAILGFSYSEKIQSEFSKIILIIRYSIPVCGFVISFLVFLGVLSACRMHKFWTEGMREAAESKNLKKRGILTFGTGPIWPAYLARGISLGFPLTVGLAWMAILYFTIYPVV